LKSPPFLICRPPGTAVEMPVTLGRMEVPEPPPKEFELFRAVQATGSPLS
jgi:hypothetical protein